MYLIDASYFNREIAIPNVNELQGNSATELTEFIDGKVRLLLQEVLGYDLFTDLNSDITNGVLKTDAEQKWKDLVNGKTYIKNGKNYRWKGLLFTEGTFKSSLLADYVYYFWLESKLTDMTGVGEVMQVSKNAVSVNSTQRLTNTWNRFVNSVNGGESYGRRGIMYWHVGVPIYDYSHADKSYYVDLFTFLKDNQTNYPDAPFTCFEYKNQFGL
jgi:hypothetical protein